MYVNGPFALPAPCKLFNVLKVPPTLLIDADEPTKFPVFVRVPIDAGRVLVSI